MAITQWTNLIRQCLLHRTSSSDVVKLLQQKPDRNGKVILKALLDCRQSFCFPTDPLPPRYLESLWIAEVVAPSDLLIVLIYKWNTSIRASKPISISEADIKSLQELSVLLTSRLVIHRKETQDCLLMSARWLTALIRSMSQNSDSLNSHIAEAVGSLLATLSATNIGIELLSEKRDGTKKRSKTMEVVRQAVESSATAFPALSVPLIDRLGAVQKHIAMYDHTQPEQSSMQALQIQASVQEMQITPSRAATVLYIETMLFMARTIDDTIVFNFLAGRHNTRFWSVYHRIYRNSLSQNDWASMFLEILLASFQVLKKSQDGPRGPLRFMQTGLFIRNKLPSILATISASSFGVVSSEQAITSAWDQVKTELTTPELLTCGQRFLYICSLHHVIASDTVQQLIGDPELDAGLPKGLYAKDELVSQINSNHSRIPKLVDELTHADGSAAAITQAIVETIISYCQSKETHHLKDLANAILKKPAAINAIAMFVRPSYWLGPLCTLLDEWRWDEIHGESQPVYEEFGSVLLLVLASKCRLNLPVSDIGIQEGFVARCLDQEGVENVTLSDESLKHLGDWIYAMYIAEELRDEVTTTCSPQEFYLLLPTLLRQTMLAHQKGKLTLDQLKGGLEYLLEPFFLPSLVSAMTWAAKDNAANTIMTPIFTKETGNEVHHTILAMKGSDWSFDLEEGNFEQELATYMAGGGFPLSGLRSLTRARGPEAALQAVLRTLSTDFSTAVDVMATLICVSERHHRDLLRLKFTTLTDPTTAAAVVHLHRRVEAYASVLIVQDIGMEFVQLSNIDTANADLDATQEQPVDDIDQVLNETAAMGSMEQPEIPMDHGDVSMDDFYGLQSDNMGLENLDDLDLEIFD